MALRVLIKLACMASGGGNPYDPDDAATYLRQYLLHNKLRHIPFSAIQQAAKDYQLRIRNEDVRRVNQCYEHKFGGAGIVTG